MQANGVCLLAYSLRTVASKWQFVVFVHACIPLSSRGTHLLFFSSTCWQTESSAQGVTDCPTSPTASLSSAPDGRGEPGRGTGCLSTGPQLESMGRAVQLYRANMVT